MDTFETLTLAKSATSKKQKVKKIDGIIDEGNRRSQTTVLPLKFQTVGLKALLCERRCYLLVRLTLFPSHLNLCFITKLVTIIEED